MSSTPPHQPSAGTKRPAPAPLLPPFEPLTSSPSLPPPPKRLARDDDDDQDQAAASASLTRALAYPTPVPTSSTHILTSSPPHQHHARNNGSLHVHVRADSASSASAPASAEQTSHQPHPQAPSTSQSISQPPRKRNPLTRTESTASERIPLSPLPCITLPLSSRVVHLGRSSISCDFQLPPSNRGISRVHVAAAYRPATAGSVDQLDQLYDEDEDANEGENEDGITKEHLEIRCLGWNGITLYCQEQSYDLRKGSVFTSDIKHADILLDVQGSRVLIRWPSKHSHDHDNDARDEEATLSGKRDVHASSPPPIPRASRLVEQISRLTPTPAPGSPVSSPLRDDGGGHSHGDEGRVNALMIPSSPVMVYEDDDRSPSVVAEHEEEDGDAGEDEENDPERSFRSRDGAVGTNAAERFNGKGRNGVKVNPLSGSDARERRENGREREREPATTRQNHGNGTANHSGNGSNAGRAASRTRKPDRHASTIKAEHPAEHPSADDDDPSPAYFDDHIPSLDASPATTDAIRNHAVNQLAFSRLNSTPLSSILNHLPPEYWRRSPTSTRGLTRSEIARIIEGTPCIGVVSREGKDAAGKPLESEYYYVPDEDGDEGRRVAVTSQLMKSGLRSCRKQHKQYYWKKPR